MSQAVITVTPAVIEKMKTTYQAHLAPKAPPYSIFSAKKNGVTITAYRSGKVMFQGGNAEAEAAKWATVPASSGKAVPKTKTAGLPAGFAGWSVIGSDEVGNGSYFGPLTVCAAFADREHLAYLKELGVRDSKELTDPQIRILAEKIKQAIPYQLLVVAPEKYNQIQPQYNAVRMKVALHNQAIRLLLQKIAPQTPDAILIDQFTPEASYRKYLRQEAQPVTQNLYFTTKGEQYHLAVAAASIVSRAAFLDWLDEASKELGLTVPSGAGSKSDQVAAVVLKKGGLPLLSQYVKLHFANTEKAQKLVR